MNITSATWITNTFTLNGKLAYLMSTLMRLVSSLKETREAVHGGRTYETQRSQKPEPRNERRPGGYEVASA